VAEEIFARASALRTTAQAAVRDTHENEAARWGVWFLLTLFVILQVTHAWVVDDAYITLRTVDNFVHGLGLRWNPGERVQSYTHPLWMFALSAVYFVTREAFYSTIALSVGVSLLAIWLAVRSVRASSFQTILLLAILLGSKAFLDYSTSGLENPLTHLLLALFFARWLGGREERRALFLLAALGFVNRMDTLLFFAPALVLLAYEQRADWRGLARDLAVGFSPALAWCSFSLLYYGTVVPNTAIAKLSGSRVTAEERLQAGLAYFADGAMFDPLTMTSIAMALLISFQGKQPRFVTAALGMVSYLFYVLLAGAMGTHMGFRFFSAALFLSAMLLAHQARERAVAYVACALVAVWMVASPVSPLRAGFDNYAMPNSDRGRGVIIDTRRFVLAEGGAFMNGVPGQNMPRHVWYRAGRDYRDDPEKVRVGGLLEYLAIGYSGFAAGPTHHFIDVLGLSDPLIARIPLSKTDPFRPGHPFRGMPEGYVESVKEGRTLIKDPDLAKYWEAIRTITQEPVFAPERLATLVRFNLGAYDPFLDAYAERANLRPR
jgi:arabinofuranosyltransferase